MKRLLYSLAVIAGLSTLMASCSDEEDFPTVSYTGCQTCEVEGAAPNYIPEDYEICTAISTVDSVQITTVYVDGANTGLSPEEYFSLYCDNEYTEGGTDGGGGSTEPGTPTTECVTCAAYTQGGETIPEMTICKGTNGNAFLGDVDTTMPYATYIQAASMFTTCQ